MPLSYTDEVALGEQEWFITANSYDMLEEPELTPVLWERHSWSAAVEQWRPLVAGHFKAEHVETALCLMGYESGGLATAKNPTSTARGLMQILASLWAPHFGLTYEELYIPEINLWVARRVYDQQGWGAWSPYNRGLCHGL